jgi:nucleotide-binding universal stress UspA family protein
MKAKSANKTDHNPRATHADDQPQLPPPTHSCPTFKTLLVPIDFSDGSLRALDYGAALARQLRAKLILLHVVAPAIYGENYLQNSGALDEANRNIIASAWEQLNKVKHRALTHGLETEMLVRMGRAQSDIADTANAIGADLIVMGTHGIGGLKQVMLGGTAERVLWHSPCPVLTVPQPKK